MYNSLNTKSTHTHLSENMHVGRRVPSLCCQVSIVKKGGCGPLMSAFFFLHYAYVFRLLPLILVLSRAEGESQGNGLHLLSLPSVLADQFGYILCIQIVYTVWYYGW